MHTHADVLVDAAARPYLAAGRYAYYFAHSKLTYDPIFMALLRSGRIPDRARVLDLGCGHAVLVSLLLAAGERREGEIWPSDWAAPPRDLQLHGVEWERRAVQRAQITLGNRATIRSGDLRSAPLPESDVVVMIDVLHYLDADAQVSLLGRVARSLSGGGLLILRLADASAGWRFHAGKAADRLGSLLTALNMPKHHHRPIHEWLELLGSLGFEASVGRNIVDRLFANKLVWAKFPRMAQA